MRLEAIVTKIKEAIADKNRELVNDSLKEFYTDFDNPHSFSEEDLTTLVKIKPELSDALVMALKFFIRCKQDIVDIENDPQLKFAQDIYDKMRPQTRLVDLSFLRPDRVAQPIYGKPAYSDAS